MKILKGVLAQDDMGRPFLEYIIEVAYKFQTWRISKKFHHFANLHKILIKNFEKVKFPSSSQIFTKISETSHNFHENKLKYLEKYIKDIANIEPIVNTKIFRKFFGFIDFYVENDPDNTSKYLNCDKINMDDYYSDEDKSKIGNNEDISMNSHSNNQNMSKSISYNFNINSKKNENLNKKSISDIIKTDKDQIKFNKKSPEIFTHKLEYFGKY